MKSRIVILFIVLAMFVVVVFFLQLMLGSVKIPVADVCRIIFFGDTTNDVWTKIILQSRFPSAMAALLAGAGLSVSGLQMQTMFRNPVAGPYVLGISSGASLGVALFILSAPLLVGANFHVLSSWNIIIAASIGAILVFVINFFISLKLNDVVAILIIGLMVGGGISALIEILEVFSSNEALKRYVLWSFGSFRYVDSSQIKFMASFVLFGCIVAMLLSKQLNLLLIGDLYATTSGLNVSLAKALIVFCTSILAGSITAFCGPIGFVGLAVPHLTRLVFKTANHTVITPATMLVGAAICGGCNLIASTPGSDFILPVNAVTSLLGAPVVIWIILKQRKI